MRLLLSVLPLSLAALGCGDDGPSPSNGPSSTSSASSGGGAGGTGGSASSSNSGGTGGTGGGPDCSAFDDEKGSQQVTFSIVNDRATPIYYRAGECAARFTVGPENDSPETAEPTATQLTCGAIIGGAKVPLDCIDDTAIEIAAGATGTLIWTGAFYESMTMPSACVPDAEPGDHQCLRGAKAPPLTLEVVVSLYGAASCVESSCSQPTDPFTASKLFAYPSEAVAITVD